MNSRRGRAWPTFVLDLPSLRVVGGDIASVRPVGGWDVSGSIHVVWPCPSAASLRPTLPLQPSIAEDCEWARQPSGMYCGLSTRTGLTEVWS